MRCGTDGVCDDCAVFTATTVTPNSGSRERLIVVHGAPYNAPKWVEQEQLGRNWGCPALDLSISDALIHTIAGGSLLFAYGSDPEWLNQSIYLDCPG
jgi:hypothetical protein